MWGVTLLGYLAFKEKTKSFFLSPANSKDHKLAVIPTQVKGASCRWITRSSCGVCQGWAEPGAGWWWELLCSRRKKEGLAPRVPYTREGRDRSWHRWTREPKRCITNHAAVLVSQAGRNRERCKRMFNFRPFAFFCPSTFCKCLLLSTVSFLVRFPRAAKWMCFSLRGQRCPLPRAERYLLARLKINGAALRFNYHGVGKGGE